MADPELAQVGRFIFILGSRCSGVAASSTCHGIDGAGTATLSRLAGQHAQYTENPLEAFNRRERTNDNAMMERRPIKGRANQPRCSPPNSARIGPRAGWRQWTNRRNPARS